MKIEYKQVKEQVNKLRKIKHLHICEEVRLGILETTEFTTIHIYTFTNRFDFDSYKKIYESEISTINSKEKLELEYTHLIGIYKAEKRKRFRCVR